MITETSQCHQAVEQMERMFRILRRFEQDVLEQNPDQFALFAQGPLDEIGRLYKDLANYVDCLVEHASEPDAVASAR